MKKISIKDIANIAGVSTATVSLVLSDKYKNGRVSENMSNKIKKIAEEMHYQPNLLAKSLQSGQSKTIGLLIADITNQFFSLLAFHIQKEMQKHDYAVIIVNTDEDNEQMLNTVSLLKSRQVDGFIIVPTEGSEVIINQLHDNKTPLVLVDRYFPNANTCNVLIDNYGAAYEATCYLLEKGCQKIAFVTYDSNLIQVSERRRGYEDAMKKHNKFDVSFIRTVGYVNLGEDVKSIVKGLRKEAIPYDGIFFATNSISLTGVKALIKDGVKINDEIKVVCFDKSDYLDFLPTQIPYIHQPIADIGCLSAKLLIEQIMSKDPDFKNETHTLPCNFVKE